jgi:drug/metabolite transporter (DMT)-like permease
MNKGHQVTYIKAIVAMTFWALTFVWIKVAFRWYTPIEIVFLRLVLASLLLIVTSLVLKHMEIPARKDVLQFILVAFFEPFCYFMGEANGMLYVSSTLGSLIISTIPLFTVFGAWLFLREKVTWWLFAGLLISFIGVAVLAAESKEIWATAKGIALMMVAVFGGMFYAITVRKLTLKYQTLTIVTWQSVFGMLFFLPLFAIFEAPHFFSMQHSGTGLLTIASMSVFASVGAFLLYTGVIRELGVIRSNLFTNLIPVLTAITAFFILGDKPTLQAVLGIALVICGLLISQKKVIKTEIVPFD